jgi:PKD repeat protein
MKKTILLLCASFFAALTEAQITITSSDMPVAGDTIRFSLSASSVSSALLNQTGANQTWNFSFLTPNNQDIAAYRTPTSINFAYLLSFGSSSYGKKDADQNIGIVAASDVYLFYKNSSSSFVTDGRGFTVSGSPLPLSQTYTGKDVLYKFPLSFGNSDTNSYSSSEVNAVVAQVSSSGRRINTVDGWGSITTPYGTFNCIRVKSVVRHTDTVKTQFINIPVTRNYTEYKWLAQGQKIPVLEIVVTSGIGGSTIIRYRDVYRPQVFVNKARFTASRTRATMSDTITFTDQSQITPAAPVSWQWTITPAKALFVNGTSATSQNPEVVFTDTGWYSVTLRSSYAAGSDDTTRTRYIQIGYAPQVSFGADRYITTPSLAVNFRDSSSSSPTSWLWSFSPATVSYTGGTSSFSQHPTVLFTDTGWYAVSLRATNIFGNRTLQKTRYIHVVNQLQPPPVAGFTADNLFPTLSTVVTFSDTSLQSPTAWQWTFEPNTVNYVGSTSASQNPKVVFSSTGFYSVTLSAYNAFGSHSTTRTNYIRVIGTGTDEAEKLSFSVYPNPASGYIQLQRSVEEAAQLTITDMSGKTVHREEVQGYSSRITLPHLTAGVYLIQLTQPQGRQVLKLCIY